MIATLFTALLTFTPQGTDELFQIEDLNGSQVVSADRRAVTAERALLELGGQLQWTVVFQPRNLRNTLAVIDVDLALEKQDPRVVAHLIAAAAGFDVLFDEGTLDEERTTMHVVASPDPFTEEGQQRLRSRAAQWYQNFLIDEVLRDPILEEEAMRVRMHLGRILRDSGDLDGAIRFYRQVFDGDHSHELASSAMLRVAEGHFDLEQYEEAEKWAVLVMNRTGLPPEVPSAIVLLGRTLLAQERYQECIDLLERKSLMVEGRPAVVDFHLLLGQAYMRMSMPPEVHMRMKALEEGLETWQQIGPRQYLDYHFLRGYGAQGNGEPQDAIRSLEWFLIRGEGEARRGKAFILLAKAYLDAGQFLEARAASMEVQRLHLTTLDSSWRREARKVQARTALALGDKVEAFAELEREVWASLDPELVLFLVDELLAAHKWQRAFNTARLISDLEDANGDQARFRMVRALFLQARKDDDWRDFPNGAKNMVLRIEDKNLMSSVMEMLAHSYEKLGDYERAADAIRGLLR